MFDKDPLAFELNIIFHGRPLTTVPLSLDADDFMQSPAAAGADLKPVSVTLHLLSDTQSVARVRASDDVPEARLYLSPQPALPKTDFPIKSISAEICRATTYSYDQKRGSLVTSGGTTTPLEYKLPRPDDNLGKDKSPPDEPESDEPNIVG